MPAPESVDVLILGGGAAGVTAAIQSARLGVRTLLVEKQAQLGGTTTTGGVNAIQSFFAYGHQVIAGIGWDLACRSYQVLGLPAPDGRQFRGAGVTNTEVDRVIYTAVIDEAVLEAGIDLRLHTMLGAARPTSDGWLLTLCGKEGLYDVAARVVIDCSGDANAFTLAGLPVVRSAERQPATLVLTLGGYDAKTLDYAAIQANFDRQVAAGPMKKSDTGWFAGSIKPILESYGGNRIHVLTEENSLDSRGRTQLELEARRIMLRLVKFFRTQPGLEKLAVTWIAPECGVRESVQIVGRSTITCEDYMSGRVWPDAVCYSFYPIDVHTVDGLDYRPIPPGVHPTIPFGAMLPRQGRQILAAGRCIAGDRLAFSAYRVQASCMAMGQAAGAAAALAVQSHRDVADIDLPTLRQTLATHGAIVPV